MGSCNIDSYGIERGEIDQLNLGKHYQHPFLT